MINQVRIKPGLQLKHLKSLKSLRPTWETESVDSTFENCSKYGFRVSNVLLWHSPAISDGLALAPRLGGMMTFAEKTP